MYPVSMASRSWWLLALAALVGCGGASSPAATTGPAAVADEGAEEGALDAPEARALVGAWYRVLAAQRPEGPGDATARRGHLRVSLLELRDVGHRFGDDTLATELDAETTRVVETLDRGGSVPIAELGSSVSHALARHPRGECGIGRLRAYGGWDLATLVAMFKAENTRESLETAVAAARASHSADNDTSSVLFAGLRLSSACFLLSVDCPDLDDSLDSLGQASSGQDAAAGERTLRAAEAALPLLALELPTATTQGAYQTATEHAQWLAIAWRRAPTEALRATEATLALGLPADTSFTAALARSAGAAKSCGIPHSLPTTQAE